MNWDELYQKGEVFWDRGAPAPALKQYLERHVVRERLDELAGRKLGLREDRLAEHDAAARPREVDREARGVARVAELLARRARDALRREPGH